MILMRRSSLSSFSLRLPAFILAAFARLHHTSRKSARDCSTQLQEVVKKARAVREFRVEVFGYGLTQVSQRFACTQIPFANCRRRVRI